MLTVLRALFASFVLAGLGAAACTFPPYSFGPLGPPSTCFDGIFQPDREGDIDCGGGCRGCLTGQTCRTLTDCDNKVCADKTCSPASCSDSIKNGDEADRDCGEACTNKCGNNQTCKSKYDCASGVCLDGRCQAGVCSDRITNGDESDVDCGGPSCPKCDIKQRCAASTDCKTGVCSRGLCAPDHCNDRQTNQDETDADCGGADCGPCRSDEKCLTAPDCESRVCVNGKCQPPSCTDGITNGTETDKDCGKACPAGCSTGQSCDQPTDCRDQICKDSACAAPTCSDNAKNGAEKGVDCGGAALSGCPGCKAGSPCEVPEDCDSLICQQKICHPPSCTDKLANGDEGDVDCGGSCSDLCKLNQTCRAGADCLTGACARTCKLNLSIGYRTESSVVSDSIAVHLALTNPEGEPIPLNELAVRYYFTKDPPGTEEFRCDWVTTGCGGVSASFTELARPLADRALELHFTSEAGSIAPGKSFQLKFRVIIPGFPQFDQSNDYSFSTDQNLRPWEKVTLYRRGSLIWGVEP